MAGPGVEPGSPDNEPGDLPVVHPAPVGYQTRKDPAAAGPPALGLSLVFDATLGKFYRCLKWVRPFNVVQFV